jgi:hypothetical protein
MSLLLRSAIAVLLLLASFGSGFLLARERRAEPASRAVHGIEVPAGLASELRAALLEGDLLDRTAAVARILDPLGPEALGEVQTAYRSVVIDTGDAELILLADWWARFDPAAALRFARDSRIGWHPAVLAAAARAWARRDPEEASRAIRASISDQRLLAAAMAGLVRGWEESGRDGLEEHLAALPAGAPRGIETLARAKVARGGAEPAIAWAESLPEGPSGGGSLRSDAIERVVEALGDSDPKAGAAWVERLRGEDPNGALAILLRLTMRWARRDGPGAMSWLRSLPPAGEVRTAVQETYRTWYLSDREAARAWLEAAELEPWLEPAAATFALQQSPTDPDLAIAWANRLSDPELRERTLVKIGLSYSLAAPEKAPEWLARIELPVEVRRRIETGLENRKRPRRGAPSAAPPEAQAPPAAPPS